MLLPACPESTRRVQAAVDESKWPRVFGISRVGLFAHLMTRPTAIRFQQVQPRPWLFMFSPECRCPWALSRGIRPYLAPAAASNNQ